MRRLAIAVGFALGMLTGSANAAIINLPTSGPLDRLVDLQPGTWQITPVDASVEGAAYTAYSVWSSSFGCDALGMHCTNGFRWAYSLEDAAGNAVSSFSTVDLVGNTLTAEMAFEAARGAGPFTFTLGSAQPLYFRFSDSEYRDNSGGVSLDLRLLQTPSNGVPTPGTALLIGLGLAALARKLAARR